jgi:glutathione reductase (NADPH)
MVMQGSLVQPLLKSKEVIVIIILNGKHILIATDSKPMNPNVPGSESIITSDQFLELGYDNLPDRIVFIGGGYISFEFAHIAAEV